MDFLLECSEILSKETLLIPVHAIIRNNHKAIVNEGFYRYFNKVQKINSVDIGSLHKWLQGVFLHCMLGIQAQ